jgi:peptide/nickel transport system substrate-binding protein
MTMFSRLATVLALATLGVGAVSVEAQQPKRGGILDINNYADPARLDPHTESSLSSLLAVAGVYSQLVMVDPEKPTDIVPDLAERYEVSRDGKTYTFHLRRGVKWHDTTPFSAADVKATIDRLLDPNFRGPRCSAMLKPMVDRFEVVDDATVRFVLKDSFPTFLNSIGSGWCLIAAKHILERDGDLVQAKSQIGTGPFKFKRYVRDSVIEWERNPNYYDSRYPYLDGVRIFILKDAARRSFAAKSGQLHFQVYPPLSEREMQDMRRQRGDALEFVKWPEGSVWTVHFNTTKPPFDNRDMRRAVFLVLNRQELIRKAYDNLGLPCVILDPQIYGDFALSLSEVGATPGCRQPKEADIEEARRLVARHYPNGLDIEVSGRAAANNLDDTQLVASELNRIGIRTTVKALEGASAFKAYAEGNFTLIGAQINTPSLNEPSSLFDLLYHSTGSRNYGQFKDAKVDRLIEQARREPDVAKRRSIYQELQRYILTEEPGGGVIVGAPYGYFLRDRRVRNLVLAPNLYSNNSFMKVWLDQ